MEKLPEVVIWMTEIIKDRGKTKDLNELINEPVNMWFILLGVNYQS